MMKNVRLRNDSPIAEIKTAIVQLGGASLSTLSSLVYDSRVLVGVVVANSGAFL